MCLADRCSHNSDGFTPCGLEFERCIILKGEQHGLWHSCFWPCDKPCLTDLVSLNHHPPRLDSCDMSQTICSLDSNELPILREYFEFSMKQCKRTVCQTVCAHSAPLSLVFAHNIFHSCIVMSSRGTKCLLPDPGLTLAGTRSDTFQNPCARNKVYA